MARRCLQCGRDIQEHRSEVVAKDQVLKAIEADANVPSTILPPQKGEGGLYLGGFAAGMNRNFLTQKHDAVGLVVNAANLALDQQFCKFGTFCRQEYPGLGISRVVLGWKDARDQTID